jgi:hypothetical protein
MNSKNNHNVTHNEIIKKSKELFLRNAIMLKMSSVLGMQINPMNRMHDSKKKNPKNFKLQK